MALNPLHNIPAVPGISAKHVIVVGGYSVECFENAVYFSEQSNVHGEQNDSTSITNEQNAYGPGQDTSINTTQGLIKLSNCTVKVGQWVKVFYEGSLFIGRVSSVEKNGCNVRCLEKLYIIGKDGNAFERERDTALYENVYKVENTPKLQRAGRQYLYVYELDD